MNRILKILEQVVIINEWTILHGESLLLWDIQYRRILFRNWKNGFSVDCHMLIWSWFCVFCIWSTSRPLWLLLQIRIVSSNNLFWSESVNGFLCLDDKRIGVKLFIIIGRLCIIFGNEITVFSWFLLLLLGSDNTVLGSPYFNLFDLIIWHD